MNKPKEFVQWLRDKGVAFFTGVPDSYLKSLAQVLLRDLPQGSHVIAANEGNAIGLAIGHYLASGQPAVVYMQNSGLGNAVNPLTSLADPEVYAVPMLLVIGWRGEPGKKDEPQHVKQGRISADLLEVLEIPYRIVGPDSDIQAQAAELWPLMLTEDGGGRPVALLVQKGAFSREDGPLSPAAPLLADGLCPQTGPLLREQAIACVLDALAKEACLVATTGKAGRELFELRVGRGEPQADFLTVGGMGHGSSIALGAALAKEGKLLVCLDGDGALLMHLGAMAVIGALKPANYLHILLNNQCHESVGGQPTCAARIDLQAIARACGYAGCGQARTRAEVRDALAGMIGRPGPHFLEILLWKGARGDLGRPTSSPARNKAQFMAHLGAREEQRA